MREDVNLAKSCCMYLRNYHTETSSYNQLSMYAIKKLKKKKSQVQCLKPVILATWVAEIGSRFEDSLGKKFLRLHLNQC
jgi:hypothetical protein